MLKRLGKSPWVRALAGNAMAGYLGLVNKTSRLIVEPADIDAYYDPLVPNIVTMWHGQHFMMPFAKPTNADIRAMISRSGDGEINAIAAKKMGMGLIRASGGQTAKQIRRRGGIKGFLEALRCLKKGISVSLTADVPKGPARIAGPGIVLLASRSGRPILPTGLATSRRFSLNSWDKATVNLPFSRFAFVAGEPIYVPPDLDGDGIDDYRLQIKQALDTVLARAYVIADDADG